MNLGVLLVLMSGVCTLVANIIGKEWSLRHAPVLFVLSVLTYFFGSILFLLALKFGGVGVLNAISALLPIVATAVVGIFWYKEIVTTPQMVGLAFGIAAIFLLTIPRHA